MCSYFSELYICQYSISNRLISPIITTAMQSNKDFNLGLDTCHAFSIHNMRPFPNILKQDMQQTIAGGQGELTFPFSTKRTVISADFHWVLEGLVCRVLRGCVSREGGRDTGVGRSSSI
jgi:hypothetical protein